MPPEQPHGGGKSEPTSQQPFTVTPHDLRSIFDQQDSLGELSVESWAALSALADQIDDDPAYYGSFVRRPDPEDFYPDLLSDELSDSRYTELAKGEVQPTTEEVAYFIARYMERAQEEGEGLYAIFGWTVEDDSHRQRILVTCHGDRGSLEQVEGLFKSMDDAAAFLSAQGVFDWIW